MKRKIKQKIGIEKDFSPRMPKILEIGVYDILNRTRLAERHLIDIGGLILGSRIFSRLRGRSQQPEEFQNLLRAITSALRRIYAAIGLSAEEQRLDLAKQRSNP